MSRPKAELPSGWETRLLLGMSRGESAEEIAKAFKGAVAPRTIRRRMQEIKTKGVPPSAIVEVPPTRMARAPSGAAAPAAVESAAEPETGAAESDDMQPANPADAEKLRVRLERLLVRAEAEGNLGAVSTLSARLISVLEHQRKNAPLPKVDPNESPDMVAAARRAREALHRLIDSAVES